MLLNSLSTVAVITLIGFTSAKPTVPPRITPFSFATKLVAGQRATVTCSTYEGAQPLTFVWLKDGSVISKGENVEKSEGEAHSTLSISPLSLRNSGNYTCVVSNAAGSDSASSPLIVYAPPRWTQTPKDTVASVGDSVSIACAAAGHPAPTITWSKDGHLMKEGTTTTRLLDNGTMSIVKVARDDAGRYQCEASNAVGDSLKAEVRITVKRTK
ncbi:cell adhesion molecule DSCAM-like [Dermacentor albipictus]|uniref:cell adhesion molecule DSCAM-like n=1 Tax=Dermacentor albipictus TaxID=60249 RepID=UPI0038FC452A